MKIATWNVNGIRARSSQVGDWIAAEQPDIVCLQEIKAAPEQVPELLVNLREYWCLWHGAGGYSGVALHVAKRFSPSRPEFSHPPFDHETRAATVTIGDLTVASVYVPNGGKDYDAKLRFLGSLVHYAADRQAGGGTLVVCGDLNVAREDRDVHPKERKPGVVGQRPEERAHFEALLACGLVDVQRALHPSADDVFTWWAPWRNLRQRNIGWRIDYVLASEALAMRATSCVSQREVGTSDHGPVVATFED